jgi:TusA-related sulfurtransferase
MIELYDYKNLHIDGAKIEVDLKAGNYSGLVLNLPNKLYHSLPQVSSTQCKYIYSNSPKHFKAKYLDNPPEPSKSAEMLLGSVVHSLVLTPDEVKDEFFIMPDMDMRTKAGKEVYAGAVAASAGKLVIKEEQFKIANDMADSVMSNRHARSLLDGAKTEISYFWKCPLTSLSLRSKVDGVKDGILIELKTARSASPSAFERQAYNMNYDLSVAHYIQGMMRWTNGATPDVYFIVVENTSPYVCQVYKATDDFIDVGHAKWCDAVSRLEVALSTNQWRGYDLLEDGILPLSAPKWSVPKEELVVENEEKSGAW